MTKMWRSISSGYRDHMSNDGNAHIAFYDAHRSLSFIWDGKAEWIEVHHGGYGEPVEWIIPAIVMIGTPAECIDEFADHCRSMIPEWDNDIWDDSDFHYSDVMVHCGDPHKHVPVPKGRSIWFYNRETKQMDKRVA